MTEVMMSTAVDQWFDRLISAVQKQNEGEGFATSNGSIRRDVEVDEFMLMNVANGQAQFKHRHTRNYVFLRADGTFSIPSTGNAWLKGTFDKAPSLEELREMLK